MGSGSDFFLALIAVLFPPIAVWIKRSICSLDSLLNLLLCILGYIPGLLHAWYIIAKYPDEAAGYEAIAPDAEGRDGARVTYYYVTRDGQRVGEGGGRAEQAGYRSLQERGYGAVQQQGPPSQGPPAQGPSQGSSEGAVPPSYDDAVKGDHKVQT
ncbi:hypothetical protein MMC26_007386 [Xylographa opegraphella]|nr:hypothetical protein [Xylographa opegraphella]